MTDLTTIADLAALRVDVDDRIERLQAERDQINQAIRDVTDGPDTYAAGNLTVQVQANRRFDQGKAEQALPPELLALCSTEKVTRTVDRKKVEVLAPAYLDACITEYDTKIVVR